MGKRSEKHEKNEGFTKGFGVIFGLRADTDAGYAVECLCRGSAPGHPVCDAGTGAHEF